MEQPESKVAEADRGGPRRAEAVPMAEAGQKKKRKIIQREQKIRDNARGVTIYGH